MVYESIDHRHRRVQHLADAMFLQFRIDLKSIDDPVTGFDHSPELCVQSDHPLTNPPSPTKCRPEIYSKPFAKGLLDAVQILESVPPDDDVLEGPLSFRNGDHLDHLHFRVCRRSRSRAFGSNSSSTLNERLKKCSTVATANGKRAL